MATKNCFLDKSRPCDLTCKAAVVVDDAVDPVDCHFILSAAQLETSAIDLRALIEARMGEPGDDAPPGATPDVSTN